MNQNCSLQCKHPHVIDVLRETSLFLLSYDGESSDLDDVDKQLFRPRVAAVVLVKVRHAVRCRVLFHNDDTVVRQRRLASLEELREVHVGQMAEHPLTPNDVIASLLRGERVQTAADVAFDPRCVFPEERLGLLEELGVQFHHVDGLKQRQQKTFCDASYSGAAVKSSASSCLRILPLNRKAYLKIKSAVQQNTSILH